MSAVHAYCTYFDYRYLSRGVAMIQSLRNVGELGPVYVLALDLDVARAIRAIRLPEIEVVTLADVEDHFPELIEVKASRSVMEYVFTLTPWLTRFVMERQPEGSWVTYLDADLYFFASCDSIYDEMQGFSVGIIPHRFTSDQRWRLRYGMYNVGWVSFRIDESGRACLLWWANRCLEWCYDRTEDGRFADQGYLDSFSLITNRVAVIQNPGANLAPWNLRGHTVETDDEGLVTVDGLPLLFFHFHGLRRDGRRYRFKHLPYGARTSEVIRDRVYRPYCEALSRLDSEPTGHPENTLLRRITVIPSGRGLRQNLLRWAGDVRGDFIDI